jgi:hypothetical protein
LKQFDEAHRKIGGVAKIAVAFLCVAPSGWRGEEITKRLKRPTDIVQRAKLIRDILAGQIEDRLPDPDGRQRNPQALGNV